MIINASVYTNAIPVAIDNDINIPGPKATKSGTTSSLTNNKLVDTSGAFEQVIGANGAVSNRGVQVGQIVYNMTAATTSAWEGPEAAVVTAVDSNTQLSLSKNIFPVTGAPSTTQQYKIYDANQAQPKGAILYIGDKQGQNAEIKSDIFVKTIDGDDVFIQGVSAGETLDVVVQRVMVGTAANAGAGIPNTLTTAKEITAFI